jgi:hypothetical protein
LPKKIPLTPEQKELIVRLRTKENTPPKEIAKRLNKSLTAIYQVLHKAGVRPRPVYRSLHGSYCRAKVPKGKKPNRECLMCGKPFYSPEPNHIRRCAYCNWVVYDENLDDEITYRVFRP